MPFRFERMAQWAIQVEFVSIVPADALSRQVPVGFEVADDRSGGSFGNAYPIRDVTQAKGRVVAKTDEHVGVIREERPAT